MARKSVVNERRRAQQLAARLQEALGLDVCTPLLTERAAAKYGQELPDHVIKLHLRREAIVYTVPIARSVIFAQWYTDEDREYLVRLVGRVWLDYLNSLLADAFREYAPGVVAA